MIYRNKLLIKLLFLITLMTLILSVCFPCFASESTPNTYSDSCILIDSNTGKILYSKNANIKMFPASTTKVMTAILAVEHCKMAEVVTVSHEAIHLVPSGYTIANLQEGEQLTVEQLLHVLLIPSANDAAYALAEHIGGSIEGFADMMNAKAKELGCKGTHFVNPNGIHNEDHYSTAYDLSLIGRYALKYDTIRDIVSTTSYTLPSTSKYTGEPRTFKTTNELLNKNSKYHYQYAIGLKTGYTEPAKNCIIAAAKKDNTELIAVVLHDTKSETGLAYREVDCKTLFEYGFNNYTFKTIATAGTIEKNIHVPFATSDTQSLDLALDSDFGALVSNNFDINSISPNIVLNSNIKAPIAKGDVIGKVTINAEGTDFTANLIATHDVFQFDFVKTSLEIVLIIVVLIIFGMIHRSLHSKSKKTTHHKSSNKKNKKSSKDPYKGFYPKHY